MKFKIQLSAIALAASWKPFVKSKTRAMVTVTMVAIRIPEAASPRPTMPLAAYAGGMRVVRVGTRQTFALKACAWFRRHLMHERFDVVVEDINKAPLYTPWWGAGAPVVACIPHLFGGTVFQDNGIAQPGAKVILASKQQPGKKLQEQTSSPRGEFAFRVPPGPAAYVISASFKGFEVASKEVDIEAQEQVHKTLLLVPSSK